MTGRQGVDAPRPTFARRPAAAAPRLPFAVLVVGLVVGGLALLLVLNTASAANELTRQQYAEADDSVAAQVQQLQDAVAASAAPVNLAAAAAAIGMVQAGNPAFLVLGAGTAVTVRGSAAPASQVIVRVPPAAAVVPATKTGTTKTGTTKTGTTKTGTTKTGTTKTTKTGTGAPPATARPTGTATPKATGTR